MAAVTVNSRGRRHVTGSLVTRFFTITGATGNTLDTGMNNIQIVHLSPGTAITAVSWSGSTITFTSSTITSEIIQVIAEKG